MGEWQNRFPAVQVRKVGSQWEKQVNPDAPSLMQAWGRRTIDQQFAALEKLKKAGSPTPEFSLHESGVLHLEDVGPTLGIGELVKPAYWKPWVRDSRAMGTFLNDLKPQNYGQGYRPFDPVLDRGVLGAGAAIGGAVGAGVFRVVWNRMTESRIQVHSGTEGSP